MDTRESLRQFPNKAVETASSSDPGPDSEIVHTATFDNIQYSQGRRHDFKSGGDKNCSRAERAKNFFALTPPLLAFWGGQKFQKLLRCAKIMLRVI